MAKTNTGLVKYAKAQLGLPYWYGTFGQIATETLYKAKKQQYPQYYKWENTPYDNFSTQYGKRVHDCVGLIKGYLWSNSPTATPKYNSAQDLSANGMRAACTERGDISAMPDTPGVLVFMSGHVGVYIGNGEVVEARGHEYGVVKTKLEGRGWKWWGKCPFIEYDGATVSSSNSTTVASSDKVSVKVTVKRVRLKAGNWNIRKLPSTGSKVITQVKGGENIEISTGWAYVPSLGGFISEKAINNS